MVVQKKQTEGKTTAATILYRRTRGTRPLQIWRSWGPQVYSVPQLLQLAVFFRWVLWEAQIASQDLLANFKGEERRVGKGMGGT